MLDCAWSAYRAELGRRTERDVNLKAAVQQVHAVDGAPTTQVEMSDRRMILVHASGPVGHHVGQLHAGRDGHREIDVRPLVILADRGRAGQRGTGDPVVYAGVGHEPLPKPIAIGGGEHAVRLIRRGSGRTAHH